MTRIALNCLSIAAVVYEEHTKENILNMQYIYILGWTGNISNHTSGERDVGFCRIRTKIHGVVVMH